MGNIQHSAEGTTWSKKNHKYIRKEGNRYIYEDSIPNPNARTARDILSDKGITRAEKRPHNAGERYYDYDNVRERGTIVNEGSRSSKGIENFHTKVNVKPKTSAREHLDNYINNRSINSNKHYTNFENQVEARREKAMAESKRQQAQQALIDYHTSHHSSKDARARGLALRSAQQNRARSNARPAREVLSDRRVARVAYTNGSNGDKRRVTQYKYKPGESRLVSSGRSARDVLSDRGVRRVSYKDTDNGRQKAVTANDFRRNVTDVRKNFGSKDTRSAFKKKISDFGKRIGIGRDAIYNYTQGVLKDSKERVKAQKQAEKEQRRREKEADRQIPLNMRLKRNAKKGKKALSKYFPFLN